MRLHQLNEKDRDILRELRNELQGIREAIQSTGTSGRRIMLKHAMWFVLPFAILWGFGAEPATAARVAVGPYVAALTVASVAWGLVSISWDATLKKVNAAIGALERMKVD